MNKNPEPHPRKALGRGLSALLPVRPAVASSAGSEAAAALAPEPSNPLDAATLPLSAILPNPDQPRTGFDPEALKELAQSIRANGIIQPVTVRPLPGQKYELIAGERRWRAAQLAGLTDIPVYIRHVEHERALEMALIENIQRSDLNPVETAHAFRMLVDQHGLSHDQIAERTGKDRSTITNFLRLLRLTEPVLQELARGAITVGHARTLLNVVDAEAQAAACKHIIGRNLSVRETETYVKKLVQQAPENPAEAVAPKQLDPNIRAAIDEMAQALGTKVRLLSRTGHSGKIEVEFYSNEDLERIYSVITTGRP